MKRVIISNHGEQRLRERTPFPRESYQKIAELAFMKSKAEYVEGDNSTSEYLKHIIKDTERKMQGEYSAKLYSNFIYLFCEKKDVIILITVIRLNEKNVKTYTVKQRLGL